MDLAVPFDVRAPGAVQLSELIGALSYALGITEGQPPGRCVRCCWIGMKSTARPGCRTSNCGSCTTPCC